jgi:hypothetical protein
MQKGDLPAARVVFEKAVKLTPRSADANMLGQVMLQQGDVEGPSLTSELLPSSSRHCPWPVHIERRRLKATDRWMTPPPSFVWPPG